MLPKLSSSMSKYSMRLFIRPFVMVFFTVYKSGCSLSVQITSDCSNIVIEIQSKTLQS